MNNSELSEKKCVPCEGGTEKMTRADAEAMLTHTPLWSLASDALSISRECTFKNFKEALDFANRIGELAEEEGHHPDLHVSWGKLGVQFSTHAIGGLSENDFIMAAKINRMEK